MMTLISTTTIAITMITITKKRQEETERGEGVKLNKGR